MKIVFCIDENFIDIAKVSIASYKRHNKNAKIIVVSEKPLPKEVGYDKNFILPMPRTFRNRGGGDRITNASYVRLFLTKLPYNKIIYVDADTICQHPLKELYDMDCQYINLCESYRYGEKQARAIGRERYGLTGMMVMNLTNLRAANFTEKCLEVEQSYPTPSTGWQHDETCINVAFGDKLQFVDQKFNYCHNRPYKNPIDESDAVILHYVGADKSDMPKAIKYSEILDIGERIRDKKVAIVGNAKSIFSKKNGRKIDNHDFIIRFNKGFIQDKKSQGSKTSLLLLACVLTKEELDSYNAEFVCNRSKHYDNDVPYTLSCTERMNMKNNIGSQPSTGFIAIDICLYFGAKSIDLYGFDFEKTPTFYNPEGYKTQHDYAKEEDIIRDYEQKGLLTIW